jgi:hypothetical protein
MLTRVGASKSYVFFVEIIIKGAVDRVDAVSRARTGSLLPRSNSQRSIRMKFELAINHMGKPERHAIEESFAHELLPLLLDIIPRWLPFLPQPLSAHA